MIKTCQNCGYIRKPTDKDLIEVCPKCSAYYKKISVKSEVFKQINPSLPINTILPKKSVRFNYFDFLLIDIKYWCFERFWIVRVPILIYFCCMLYVKLTDWQGWTIFDGINLGIHEMGHPLFGFFGRYIGVAGGTILQCLAPILSMIVLGKQRDYFGINFCIGWLATNLIGISVYMSDATDLALTLVTIGGGSNVPVPKEEMHDWHILFESLGVLEYDKFIGNKVYWLGILMLTFSILFGSLLVYWMAKLKKEDLKLN